jgi:TrmH family RNA methyltransferase
LTTLIQSPKNQQYRRWRRFASAPERIDCPWIPVEGKAQLSELAQKHLPELLLYCPELCSPSSQLLEAAHHCVELPIKLFKSLSEVESTQGILAFFSKPIWNWADITPYVLYLDRLQDPGNLGTLLRTAAATGVFSIVTSPGTVSCFKNKVVRSSAGYLFDVPFLQEQELSTLMRRAYRIFVALPNAGQSLFKTVFEPPLALIIGSESKGVDLTQLGSQVESIHIPMAGSADSLNAAVSGSILMYESIKHKLP